MKPGVISVENAMEILPDAYRRKLTDEARRFAEAGTLPRQEFGTSATYWDTVVNEHAKILWMDAYQRRKARLERLAAKTVDSATA